MNKFLQWLKSLTAGFTPKLAETKQNVLRALTDAGDAGLTFLPEDNTGLSAEAVAMAGWATDPTLKSNLLIQQSDLDRNIQQISKGDPRANAILRLMACASPLFDDLNGNRAYAALNAVRGAGVSGKNVEVLFNLCHTNPIKMLGVLYAREYLGTVDTATIENAIATYGKPDAQPLPVNQIFQGVMDTYPELAQFEVPSGPTAEKSTSLQPPPWRRSLTDSALQPLPWRRSLTDSKLADAGETFNSTKGLATSSRMIEEGDSVETAVKKLGRSDMEARAILSRVASLTVLTDKDSTAGAMGPLRSLDAMFIAGGDITRLHKVCGENPYTMLAVLRAEDLGFVSKEKIHEAIFNQGKEGMPTLNTNALLHQVMEALPNFSYPLAATGSGSGLPQGSGRHLPAIPDTSKIPRVSGQQPDQAKEIQQGGDGK